MVKEGELGVVRGEKRRAARAAAHEQALLWKVWRTQAGFGEHAHSTVHLSAWPMGATRFEASLIYA